MSSKKKKNRKERDGKAPPAGPPLTLEQPAAGGRRFELAFAALLLLALVFYFRDFIFTPGAMIFGSDLSTQGFQTRKIAVDAMEGGHGMPLWNPFSYCGIPYVGALPGPMFFPTSVLYYMMPLGRAIGWSYLLVMFAGGLFFYLWVRELGLHRVAAAVTGVSFTFMGWVASPIHGGHDGRMFTVLMMPLVFFFLERALARRKLVYFLLMGLAVALQILSPHMQLMYFSSLAAAAYFLFRVWGIYREEGSLREPVKLAAGFACGFVLAVALSAAQFLPVLANRGFSHRQTGTGLGFEGWQHATQYSMHPLELLSLVVPGFTGEPTAYWPAAQFKLHSEYAGLVPLLFAVVAIVRRRTRMTWFFIILAVVATLFAFGGFTPVYRLPYHLLPQFKAFRAPNMMFTLSAFGILTLAAYGLDYLLGGGRDEREAPAHAAAFRVLLWTLGAVVFFAIIIGAGKDALPGILGGMIREEVAQQRIPLLRQHYGVIMQAAFLSLLVAGLAVLFTWLWRERKIPLAVFAALLAVLAFGDLMRMDRHWIEVEQPEQRYPRDEIVRHLEQQPEHAYRVFFYPTAGSQDYWDNSLLYFGIPTINASQPLRLEWYERLMGTHMFRNFARHPALWRSVQEAGLADERPIPGTDNQRLWNMLNTRFVMFRDSRLTPLFEKEYPFLERVVHAESTGKILYRNLGAWPRYRLFGACEVLADDDSFVPLYSNPSFDPENTLILSGEPEFDRAALSGAAPEGEVELVSYDYGRLELRVTSDRPCLLYAAETWHPYWRAEVDGEPARMYRANLAMRAVFLEGGEHTVVMRYESAPYAWGKRLSILSLLLLAAFTGWTAWRKDW